MFDGKNVAVKEIGGKQVTGREMFESFKVMMMMMMMMMTTI